MLAITASIFSAKGRAASAAVCARRSFDAATICMALVIFCGALVEAMRTRMSFKLAIAADLSSGSTPFPPPLRGRVREGGQQHQSCCSPPSRPASPVDLPRKGGGNKEKAFAPSNLIKQLCVSLDHRLTLGPRLVAQVAATANGVQNI